jgi:hypothetical protein
MQTLNTYSDSLVYLMKVVHCFLYEVNHPLTVYTCTMCSWPFDDELSVYSVVPICNIPSFSNSKFSMHAFSSWHLK